MAQTLLTLFLAILFVPAAQAATDVPVQNSFAAFTMPKGWAVVENRTKKLPKPLVYFRQKYQVTVVSGPTGAAYIYAQDLPAFRGKQMSLADIDAAFERSSQLSSDTSALADNYVPSIMEMKSATGTFLGKPSREIEFWTERDLEKITIRMSHVSFDGKLYALEFYSTKGADALDADWKTLHDSMFARSTSSSGKKTDPTKVDRSPRGSQTKPKVRRRVRPQSAMLAPVAAPVAL